MAGNEITKKWVVDMVLWMKEQKQSIASCIMFVSDPAHQYILLENGSMFEIKPVELPFEMPSHELKGKSGERDYTLTPGYMKPTKPISIPIKDDRFKKGRRKTVRSTKKDGGWF